MVNTKVGAVSMRLALAGLGVLVAASVSTSCRAGGSDVPTELRGVWTTGHHEYEGRSFELRENTLVITTGVEPAQSYVVDWVEDVHDDENVTHRIHYVNELHQDFVLSFAYDAARDRIAFSNQPALVWSREQ